MRRSSPKPFVGKRRGNAAAMINCARRAAAVLAVAVMLPAVILNGEDQARSPAVRRGSGAPITVNHEGALLTR